MNKKLFFITPEMIDWDVMYEIVNKVDVIIYRSKTKEFEEKLADVKKLVFLCQRTIVLVNDDVDLCLEARAGGVVVSRDDANAIMVRDRIGSRKLIGYRTSSLVDIQVASASNADFLLAGNIFFDTDKIKAKLMDLEEVRLIRSITDIPIILTGGLTLDNITDEIISICDGLSFSSYLSIETADRIEKIKNLLRG